MKKNEIRVTNRGIEFEGIHYIIWNPMIIKLAHEIKKYNMSRKSIIELLNTYADDIEC